MNKKVALSILSATVVASMASSAFAAPKSGVYLGGDVDRYYELRDLFNLTDAGKTKFAADMAVTSFDKLIYVDFDGKGASLREIMNGEFSKVKRDLKKSDFEGVYTKSNLDGTNGATYDPRNDAIDGPTGDLKVDSVAAVSGSQIKINFSIPVSNAGDKLFNAQSKALNTTNVKVAPLGSAAAIGNLTASLSEDGKTLTITNDVAFNGDYSVYVKKDSIISKDDVNKKVAEFLGNVKITDSTAPVYTGVTYDGSTAIVKFSEPLKSVGTVTLDGKTLTASDYTLSGDTLEVTGLTAGKASTLVIVGATDNAGNIIAPNPTTVTLTAPVDTVKPTVAVSAKNTTLTFKFSEALKLVNADGGQNPDDFAKVTIGNATFTLGASHQDANDKTKFTVDAAQYVTGSFLNATVKVEAFTDKSGLVGDAFTTSVMLTKDNTAPAFVSASSKDDKLIVKFDEDVDANSLTSVAIKYTDKDNVVTNKPSVGLTGVVSSYDANNNGIIDGDDENYLVLPVSDVALVENGKLKPGKYEVTIGAGKVQDKVPNATTADTKFTLTVTGSSESSAVVEVVDEETNQEQGVPGKLVVKFNKQMASSALVAGNYSLDGVALNPSTSNLYFDGSKDKVVIELPEGFISASGNRLLKVANVVDVDGNTLKAGEDTDVVNLDENVKPVASSVALVDSSNFVINFSEEISLPQGAVTGVTVKVNGATTKLADTTPFKVNSDNKSVTVAVYNANSLTVNDQINVTFQGANIVDKKNNAVKDGSVSNR
ncbi:hypothetical protein [Brevibacillus brevis]|uniref:hypothetical protein n=1 Tax=Brevibacillus brevis TaxID=1393 RepID=UPI000D0FBE5D|nr:hypothetical protein [Brevibacillus brevis]PSJ68382.1 hypothetical protein C7J99_14255 [Brevibacillus brevis]RED34325.1 hypothetical protein DES34_102495 [Brevibacillus brevis]GEC91585.1 hypothetical protein BBR01nite_39160 [Brevibacillus brevis]VEF92105.1 Outer cell wall protein precursor [Brevibacillus brevis]